MGELAGGSSREHGAPGRMVQQPDFRDACSIAPPDYRTRPRFRIAFQCPHPRRAEEIPTLHPLALNMINGTKCSRFHE